MPCKAGLQNRRYKGRYKHNSPTGHIKSLIKPQKNKIILMHLAAFILSGLIIYAMLLRMNKNWADLNMLAENQQKAIMNSTIKLRETNESLQAEVEHRRAAEESLKSTNMQMGKWIGALQDRSRQMILMNQMSSMLHSCTTIQDAYKVAASFIRQMPVFGSGVIYSIEKTEKHYKIAESWGRRICKDIFWPDECWAIKLGRMHKYESDTDSVACSYFAAIESCICVCIPLMTSGEIIGLISFLTDRSSTTGEDDFQSQMTLLVAEHISLSLTNIQLRSKLLIESIKDPLTNLYNRRYLDDILHKEVFRSARTAIHFA